MTAVADQGAPPRFGDIARHVVKPDGIISTGWPGVEATCREIRLEFDSWQAQLGRLILAKDTAGLYASTTSCISIPRQAGKTYLIAAIVFALCIREPDLTVLWTAHRYKTAQDTFKTLAALARAPDLLGHIDPAGIYLGRGEQRIEFRNGSSINFGARERGAGRGLPHIGVLVFDEAQILSAQALEDMGPTINTHHNPLVLMTGTPPRPNDPGEAFTGFREEALDGTSDDVLYVEFSADTDAEIEDWGQWAKANPSYPHRTSKRAIRRLCRLLGGNPASIRREGFGIWDERAIARAVVADKTWQGLLDPGPDLDVPPTGIGIDQSHDGVLAVAACWQTSDVQVHLDLLQVGQMVDLHGVASWIAGLAGRKIPVFVDSYSPASPLIPLLKAQKVKVKATSATDMANGCGMFLADATAPWEDPEDRRLTHSGTAHLDGALQGATKRKIGDAGGWGWDRRNTESLISPLVAATLARLAASQRRTRTGADRTETTRRSSDGRRSGGTRRALVT